MKKIVGLVFLLVFLLAFGCQKPAEQVDGVVTANTCQVEECAGVDPSRDGHLAVSNLNEVESSTSVTHLNLNMPYEDIELEKLEELPNLQVLVLPNNYEAPTDFSETFVQWLNEYSGNRDLIVIYNYSSVEFDVGIGKTNQNRWRLIDRHSRCESMRMEAYVVGAIDDEELQVFRLLDMVPVLDKAEGDAKAVVACDE